MIPVYWNRFHYQIVLHHHTFPDFVKTNILCCPLNATLQVNCFDWNEGYISCLFTRIPDGFLYDPQEHGYDCNRVVGPYVSNPTGWVVTCEGLYDLILNKRQSFPPTLHLSTKHAGIRLWSDALTRSQKIYPRPEWTLVGYLQMKATRQAVGNDGKGIMTPENKFLEPQAAEEDGKFVITNVNELLEEYGGIFRHGDDRKRSEQKRGTEEWGGKPADKTMLKEES
ncbi:uncharacterized protein NPIL_106181 [Nephila pilipes]|uniref:Uncharacterized protein n=1 Tax=Nephila pilipes TaxID=299642 RepID=A0A8X6QZP4_NEPPI|nr:uncharacterized protein NPIL_106181 [Nephila pilipes]